MRPFPAILPIIALLASCTVSLYPPPLDSSFRLQLNRAYYGLTNDKRIYFQDGERIAWNLIDRWKTYCAIYLFDPTRGTNQTVAIEPGGFALSQVRRGFVPFYEPLGGPAFESGAILRASFDFMDRSTYYLYRVEMRLTSSDQPHVNSLSCYRLWDETGNRYPTLADMRRALGEVASLVAPSD